MTEKDTPSLSKEELEIIEEIEFRLCGAPDHILEDGKQRAALRASLIEALQKWKEMAFLEKTQEKTLSKTLDILCTYCKEPMCIEEDYLFLAKKDQKILGRLIYCEEEHFEGDDTCTFIPYYIWSKDQSSKVAELEEKVKDLEEGLTVQKHCESVKDKRITELEEKLFEYQKAHADCDLCLETEEKICYSKQLGKKDKRIAELEAKLAGTNLEKFGEGASFTENRLWDFVTGKTNKPSELAFTSGKSRDIAREFERLKIKIAELEKENQELNSLLKKASEKLYCPEFGKNATKFCSCDGCKIRKEISENLRGEKS